MASRTSLRIAATRSASEPRTLVPAMSSEMGISMMMRSSSDATSSRAAIAARSQPRPRFFLRPPARPGWGCWRGVLASMSSA